MLVRYSTTIIFAALFNSMFQTACYADTEAGFQAGTQSSFNAGSEASYQSGGEASYNSSSSNGYSSSSSATQVESPGNQNRDNLLRSQEDSSSITSSESAGSQSTGDTSSTKPSEIKSQTIYFNWNKGTKKTILQ
jgi:hypothetical protein